MPCAPAHPLHQSTMPNPKRQPLGSRKPPVIVSKSHDQKEQAPLQARTGTDENSAMGNASARRFHASARARKGQERHHLQAGSSEMGRAPAPLLVRIQIWKVHMLSRKTSGEGIQCLAEGVDFSADSRRRKRALPPADGSDVPPTPDPNAVGDALSLSNVNALPTFYPSSSTLPVEIGASSHCTTTMTTTITPGCSPTASSGSRNDSGSPRADDYNDIEDCDEEMDTSPLRVGETPPTANNQEPIEVEGTELADETISRYSISSSVAPTPSDVSEMAQLASTPSLTGVSGAHDTTIANPQEVDPMKIDFE